MCGCSLTVFGLAGDATEPSPSLETTVSGREDKGDNNPFDTLFDNGTADGGADATVVSGDMVALLFSSYFDT